MPAGGCDVSVLQYSTKVLDDISIYLNKAVVYLDDVSAEVIHWHGGATMLFNYGVLDIREFSSFEVNISIKKGPNLFLFSGSKCFILYVFVISLVCSFCVNSSTSNTSMSQVFSTVFFLYLWSCKSDKRNQYEKQEDCSLAKKESSFQVHVNHLSFFCSVNCSSTELCSLAISLLVLALVWKVVNYQLLHFTCLILAEYDFGRIWN